MTVRLWGPARPVNDTVAGDQGEPQVAVLPFLGLTAVTWWDAASGFVMLRLIGPDGEVFTPELPFSDDPLAVDARPTIALTTTGFAITYTDGAQTVVRSLSLAGPGVDGAPATGENLGVAGAFDGGIYILTRLANGDLAVQKNDANGQFTASQVLNTSNAEAADIATVGDGTAIVVWRDTGVGAVLGEQIFTDGSSIGFAFPVLNDATADTPHIAPLEDGGIVVIATVTGPTDQNVMATVFDAFGASRSFRVNGATTGDQRAGDVVGLANGGFIAVWWSSTAGGAIRGQQFDAAGARVGQEFRVGAAPLAPTDPLAISAALTPDGRVAVTWTVPDGDGAGSVLQLLDPRDGYVEGTEAGEALFGSAFADQVLGLGGEDLIVAGAAGDEVRAGAGNDEVYGDAGDDALHGEDGDDYLQGGAGLDAIDGGGGDDLVCFCDEAGDVVLTLAGARPATATVGGRESDTVVNVEGVLGGDGNDALTGDDADNRLEGGDGNDVLAGGLGADTLAGGDGVDTADYGGDTRSLTVFLKSGVVTADGASEDRLSGIERVLGGAAGDRLYGDDGDNLLRGGAGNDQLTGGGGNDTLEGGDGAGDVADFRDKTQAVVVTLNGASVSTATVGGVAEDTLRGIEFVFGGAAADTLTGDGNANILRGGGGADIINGGGGSDSIDFRDKTAQVVLTLDGGNAVTATVGGLAEDVLRNVEGIYGGSAADVLTGDQYNNRLTGGAGDDVLRGGRGADVLVGGPGADTFVYGAVADSLTTASRRDTISDFASKAGDRIDLSAIDANTTLADDQAFTVGELAVGEAGRLRLTDTGGSRSLVEGDVNGDGVADFALVVEGSFATLSSSDFVL